MTTWVVGSAQSTSVRGGLSYWKRISLQPTAAFPLITLCRHFGRASSHKNEHLRLYLARWPTVVHFYISLTFGLPDSGFCPDATQRSGILSSVPSTCPLLSAPRVFHSLNAFHMRSTSFASRRRTPGSLGHQESEIFRFGMDGYQTRHPRRYMFQELSGWSVLLAVMEPFFAVDLYSRKVWVWLWTAGKVRGEGPVVSPGLGR